MTGPYPISKHPCAQIPTPNPRLPPPPHPAEGPQPAGKHKCRTHPMPSPPHHGPHRSSSSQANAPHLPPTMTRMHKSSGSLANKHSADPARVVPTAPCPVTGPRSNKQVLHNPLRRQPGPPAARRHKQPAAPRRSAPLQRHRVHQHQPRHRPRQPAAESAGQRIL